jgi:CheY-like chemotaxis protein
MEEWKIFLVDDDAEDRFIVEEALQTVEPGVHIKIAENGHEGLKVLIEQWSKGSIPSLIILDVNMPKLGGPEILRSLKNDSRFKDIPVVIYSTSINPYEKESCIRMGAHSYITKPVSYNESIEVAKAFLGLCHSSKTVSGDAEHANPPANS